VYILKKTIKLSSFYYGVPSMGNNLTVKVRCRLDSGNC